MPPVVVFKPVEKVLDTTRALIQEEAIKSPFVISGDDTHLRLPNAGVGQIVAITNIIVTNRSSTQNCDWKISSNEIAGKWISFQLGYLETKQVSLQNPLIFWEKENLSISTSGNGLEYTILGYYTNRLP